MIHGQCAPEVLRQIADELKSHVQDAWRIRPRLEIARRQPAAAIRPA
jgi:hypothetical protein